LIKTRYNKSHVLINVLQRKKGKGKEKKEREKESERYIN
jgi:hypothetical protein